MVNKEEKNIFRLAAIVYKDDNYNIRKENTIKKIIESIFLENNDFMLTTDLTSICNEKYKLTILNEAVEEIVKNNSECFELMYLGEERFKFRLNDKRYKTISSSNYNDIEAYISTFLSTRNYDDKSNVKEIIYRYLYEVFTSNLESYKLFFNEVNNSAKVLNLDKFTDYESNIINEFLNYDNPNKDKAIFNIVSLSLEYCLLTGNGKQVYAQGLKNKCFYLDSNIVYRSIGINGSERKESTLKFIKKCNDIGIEMKITKFTNEEFRESIKNNIKKLSSNEACRSNEYFFERYSKEKDLINYYHQWCSGRSNKNFSMFEAYTLSQYDRFLEENKINIDYTHDLDDKDSTKSQIDIISNSIGQFKENSGIKSDVYDAKNYILIKRLRKSNNVKLLETKYFLISTDQKLRQWDYIENTQGRQPIVFLPSQWLAIILRFYSATSDDYRSFVSFLNIKNNIDVITSEKLQAVLVGIEEMTSDFESQKYYAKEIIENQVEDILLQDNPKDIKEEVKKYIGDDYRHKIEIVQSEATSAREESAAMKLENKDLEEKNKKLLEKNTKLESENKRHIEELINKRMKKWKNLFWLDLFIIFLIITWIILHFSFIDFKYNFVQIIYNYFKNIETAYELIKWLDLVICGTLSLTIIRNGLGRINEDSNKYKKKYENIAKSLKNR